MGHRGLRDRVTGELEINLTRVSLVQVKVHVPQVYNGAILEALVCYSLLNPKQNTFCSIRQNSIFNQFSWGWGVGLKPKPKALNNLVVSTLSFSIPLYAHHDLSMFSYHRQAWIQGSGFIVVSNVSDSKIKLTPGTRRIPPSWSSCLIIHLGCHCCSRASNSHFC